MSEGIEKIARAIHEAEFNPNNYAEEPEFLWDNLDAAKIQTRIVQAQAAIIALRQAYTQVRMREFLTG